MPIITRIFFATILFHVATVIAEQEDAEVRLQETITLTPPSLFSEFKRFINFNFNLSQQQFRYSVPKGWIADDSMYSKLQNRNFIGEYNDGYFEYQMHPSITQVPSISFDFWDSKIARAEAIFIRRAQLNNDDLITLGKAIKNLISGKYGDPEHTGDQLEIEEIWKVNGRNLRLQADRGNPRNRFSVAYLSLEVTNEVLYEEMRKFTSRRKEPELTDKHVASVVCSKQLQGGNVLEFGLAADTRMLPKEAADIIAYSKKQALGAAGFECEIEVKQLDREEDERYERRFSQKRTMKTFLFFIDKDGFKNIGLFVNAEGKVEDELCEVFLADIAKHAREARCITGTKIFYK